MRENAEIIESFVPIARNSHFPLQNLPYGVFAHPITHTPQIGTAIGEFILNLSQLELDGYIKNISPGLLQNRYLNPLMATTRSLQKNIRLQIQSLLAKENAALQKDFVGPQKYFVSQKETTMLLPVKIGDYTDFYASKEHATNVGAMFRDKNNPLLPNWVHLPIGYHGRASSVIISGTPVRRPKGQIQEGEGTPPSLKPSARLDFELELAFYIGQGNELGCPIPISEAKQTIFGFCLLNDWSARDIQKWEYVPLGPFVSKSFATSVSPWVVTIDAIEPFFTMGPTQTPTPLPYLQETEPRSHLDINLTVKLVCNNAKDPAIICQTNSKYLYWSMAQQIAHHTITGCNLKTGDLLASGTISGPLTSALGCLLEMTEGGKKPLRIAGKEYCFLQDGDEIIIEGWCEKDQYRIGLGEVRGKILPSG